jgi:hypothetical protein
MGKHEVTLNVFKKKSIADQMFANQCVFEYVNITKTAKQAAPQSNQLVSALLPVSTTNSPQLHPQTRNKTQKYHGSYGDHPKFAIQEWQANK